MIAIKKLAILPLAWTASVLLATAAWAEPADTLVARLQQFDRLQGRFEQSQFDANNTLLAKSGGSFKLLRPGYFAWDIRRPDSQLIIADPVHIWHFDRDLDTVTRRPIAASRQASPLQVLGGDAAALREQFEVKQSGPQRFVLTPRGANPDFSQLTVVLATDGIDSMEIRDRLDQRIAITLTELDSESELTAADFAFTPPPQADLFYYDE